MSSDFSAIAADVTDKMGMALSDAQLTCVTAFLRRRFALLGCADAGQYAQRLDDPAEFRALVDCFTVPETFFYRFSTQWEAIRNVLLPGLVAQARAAGRKARFWSAGCCTGEEPYTLAIIAAEAGCAEQVDILATDVNEGYLEAAARGRFSPRSVEKLSSSLIDKYFKQRGGALVLDDSIRRQVRFKPLNLAERDFPLSSNGTEGLDMIFCENVLIYFKKKKAEEISLRFRDCLREGGHLALGPSELVRPGGPLLVKNVEGAFFYLKDAGASAGPAPSLTRRADQRPRAPAPASAPAAAEGPADWLVQAESLADMGKREEAAALCRRALKARPLEVKTHYLLGLIESDRPDIACGHFRKALYLDPSHLLARLHLARCAEKLGRVQEAAREYGNLERLTSHRPPGDIVDAREGISFGMLAALCRRYTGAEKEE